jgi:hypothetical protein
MLGSTQSSLEAMQRLYAAAQNQLFELQSNKEAAVVVKQVRRREAYIPRLVADNESALHVQQQACMPHACWLY